MWVRISFRREAKLVDSVSSGIEERMEANERCSEYCEWMVMRFLVMLIDWEYACASCSAALSFKARARDCIGSSTPLQQMERGSHLKVGNHIANIQRWGAGSNKAHE